MTFKLRHLVLLLPLLVWPGAAAVAQSSAGSPAAPEIRALWVDAFHAGIRSPEEARTLVDAAVRAHLNTLFVQVRRRGDVLFAQGLDPQMADPAYDPAFDALAHIVETGHAAGLQVHAWINAAPVWRDEAPPASEAHVFNLHGPTAQGKDLWLTSSRDGNMKFPVGYFLDLGHPAAADYLTRVYVDVARRYKVDGIHFDYIRYPETEPPLPRGADVGYNAVSLSRFHAATGRSDTPAVDDEAWSEWRRAQVTHLVRRVALEAREVNPAIRVSAAVIAWGAPPTRARDFVNVSPMQRIFQDWRGWLRAGWLDIAVPMNYARERDERVRTWFDGWIAFEKKERADRALVIGLGAYLNSPADVLAQVERARRPDRGKRAQGVSFFSYWRPFAPPPPTTPPPPVDPMPGMPAGAPQLPAPAPPPLPIDFLREGVEGRPGAFVAPAPVPSLDWIDRPEKGCILGQVLDVAGAPRDGARVSIRRGGWFRKTLHTEADGNGYFGMARLSPGRYRVRFEPGLRRPAEEAEADVTVSAGRVSRVMLRPRLRINAALLALHSPDAIARRRPGHEY